MAMQETSWWREHRDQVFWWGCAIERGETTWVAAADTLGKSASSIRQKFAALKLDPTFQRPADLTPLMEPRPEPAELWQLAKEITQKDLARHATERLAKLDIDDPFPIGIANISDQHIRGSGPIDLDRMEADARLVAATPGLYGVLGGDGVDNHIKHRAAMVAGGTKIADDWRRYEHYLGFFDDALLAMISGNHDDWTRDFAGVDMVGELAKRQRVHYAPDEMVLDINLPGQSYRLKFRHQYRYNSSFNQVHTVKRLWEMGDDPFDVGVVCHHHEAAIEQFTKHGKAIWGARPGSYQLTSSYSRQRGFSLTRPTCPTFIFFPGDEREIIGFADVRRAAEVLTLLRAARAKVTRRNGKP